VKSSLIQPLQGIQQGYAVGYDFCHAFNVTILVDKIVSVLMMMIQKSQDIFVTNLT
jgi:hypothetical protein